MEQAAQPKTMVIQAAASINMRVLKEPRGFIKFIELIIAIFAFATTTSHSSASKFTIDCGGESDVHDLQCKYSYPFHISSQNTYYVPYCNDTITDKYEEHPYGNFKAPSQFYVFVGVMAFLYTIGALVLYIMFDDKYRSNENIPIADFIISAVFTVCWLIASSAWAQGVTDLKYYTDPNEIIDHHLQMDCQRDDVTCKKVSDGNFASLNVSIIFGFLNMVVWGGNLWFLFKETKWFVRQQAPADMPPPTEQPPPQRI